METKIESKITKGNNGIIPKKPKTILKDGMTYSLISRVRNAFNSTDVAKMDKGTKVKMIDGRGSDREISQVFVDIAHQLGTKFLAKIKSSYLRPRMQWDGKKITLVEPEKKIAPKALTIDESKKKIKKAS